MTRMLPASDALFDYIVRVGAREHPVLRRCREETARHPHAGMQIGPDQGGVMALLAQLTGAKRYLEIGTFTGYSALAVALAVPPDGQLVCCDVSKEYTDLARGYWQEAGVAAKIDLRLGPALETLDRMIADGEKPFDFAFIDADKPCYDAYYERVLKLVRAGGLIALDNMLWSGEVADFSNNDETTVVLRALNQKIHDDPRVDMAMLALGDGVMLARKR
ncbi:MAG TPA: class I SAM-dependent methyltransferase [Rhizomicrobium sp.]|nr:class I SAM-dependent methyltransferase [Rhizomicrobium sp.]